MIGGNLAFGIGWWGANQSGFSSGKSCGKFLRENLVGNSCGKIFREILAGKSCGKFLWENLAGNAVGNLAEKVLMVCNGSKNGKKPPI